MKQSYLLFIIAAITLLLCGCGTKNKLTPKQPDPAHPILVPVETPEEPAEQPALKPAKKTKPATQAYFDAALNGDFQAIESEHSPDVLLQRPLSRNGESIDRQWSKCQPRRQ
jgi:hypothetical protein